MQVRPVVTDASVVVDAVGEQLGRPLRLRAELDIDVYRLQQAEGGDLVARVFGPGVGRAAVDAAAEVLERLGDTRFPAERCAAPVIDLGEGRHVLVTEHVDPSPAARPGSAHAWCAALLGRLATRSGDGLPAGGGWHRLGRVPSQEIDEALDLGGRIGSSVAALTDALADADDGAGLPAALIHADLTPPNVVPQGDRAPVVIDWVGVGRGPRAWALAPVLFASGPRAARRQLERYARSVSLCEEERRRLPSLLLARPLTLDLWSVAYERLTAPQANRRLGRHRARIAAISAALAEPA